jgi:hypothetical protein
MSLTGMSATKEPEAEPEPMLAEAKPRFSTAPFCMEILEKVYIQQRLPGRQVHSMANTILENFNTLMFPYIEKIQHDSGVLDSLLEVHHMVRKITTEGTIPHQISYNHLAKISPVLYSVVDEKDRESVAQFLSELEEALLGKGYSSGI